MLLMKCAELKEKVQKSRKARVCSPSASCGLLGRRDDAYNDREHWPCFHAFLSNHWAGASVFAGLYFQYLLVAPGP